MENLIILFILIILNAFFSIAEMSIATSRKIKLQQMIESGNKKALKVLSLSESPNNFITVVQIGLNIVALLAGIFGEGALSPIINKHLTEINVYYPEINHVVSMSLAIFLIALLFIWFAELIPKRIALLHREEIACSVIDIMLFLLSITLPIVKLLSFLTDKTFKLFGVDTEKEDVITHADIVAAVDAGAEAGVIGSKEQYIVENAFSLVDQNVTSVMTHKKDIVYIDLRDSEDEIKNLLINRPHSRYLICDSEIDNLLGFIETQILLSKFLTKQNIKFDREKLKEQGLNQILVIPDSLNLLDVLERFKENRQDIAVIINEYGIIVGLITLNDVMSTLVKDVMHSVEDDGLIVKRAENSWLIDGKTAIQDVKTLFGWDYLPDEQNYETISGFLMFLMKKMPKKADVIKYDNVIFEIVDTDNYRIDEVMATKD